MNKELDEQDESKACLCERLFAFICESQFKAQSEVNSSTKDRFFASASRTPGRVMDILLTQYTLVYQRETKGIYNKSIAKIAVRTGNSPDKLTLAQRREFALSYCYRCAVKQDRSNNNDN